MSVELPLYRYGKLAKATALVDDGDAVYLDGSHLTLVGGYVFVGERQLHRILMGCARGDGHVVHHINEDPTDNRRGNLKVCSDVYEHGDQPHPWRDRMSSLVGHRMDANKARALIARERIEAGLRPVIWW